MNLIENEIEKSLISRLKDLGYEHRTDIRDRKEMESNFRMKFENLNNIKLTDAEFERLLKDLVTPDVYEVAEKLRNRNAFIRDDGTNLYYTLVNIKDWCKNTFEVVNQLRINTDNSHHRYDVIILINGLPVAQLELKAVGINVRRAMEQVVKYKKDSGSGYTRTILCFIQLFIVSNQVNTWYFANNNEQHFTFDAEERFLPVYQLSDDKNQKITHLDDFSDHFLSKCTLGEMISKFMVLIFSEKKIVIMRPYQVYAVKAILDCIERNGGNGYIWHTTGSGKTLTSFKAATILKENDNIHKCLFVVDRKDLDFQTRKEFNKFQEGCVEENTSTASLVDRFLSNDYADKVIVTTIQKLGLALDTNRNLRRRDGNQNDSTFRQRLADLRNERIVIIFDECHRSQFGEYHSEIRKFFPNAQLFGFTGTPIFPENASAKQISNDIATMRTTEDLFEHRLHEYTITDAIEDKNVLRFRVEYYRQGNPMRKDTKGSGHQRIRLISRSILEKHKAATYHQRFNAILATASIDDAIAYYSAFREIRSESPQEFASINVAAVFTPPPEGNRNIRQIQEDLPQESFDNLTDPEGKKAALELIIQEYNSQYGTNHSVSGFDSYYQDVQTRIKSQRTPNQDLPRGSKDKIDITIVVDMLLTGFDSQYLNTLYVDKNLKHHNLIQAFSRTNRVLNVTKPFGQIFDFRGQQDSVDSAFALFSGLHVKNAREYWLVEDASSVIGKFEGAVSNLKNFMATEGLEMKPQSVYNLRGGEARIRFVDRFREVRRLREHLSQYTDLSAEDEERIETRLPQVDYRSFSGAYLQVAQQLREEISTENSEIEGSEEDLPDLDLVLFSSSVIDYDYIMALIAKYTTQVSGKREVTRKELVGLIETDSKFMSERDEIVEYVNGLKEGTRMSVEEVGKNYIEFKTERRNLQIEKIAALFGLTAEHLKAFIDTILRRMVFDGELLTDLFAPLELNWRERRKRELALMANLIRHLKKWAHGREISGLSAYEQETRNDR